MSSKLYSFGRFILTPNIEEAQRIAFRVGGLVLSRPSDLWPGIQLMKSGRHIALPIRLAPPGFQVPFGTDVLISTVFDEKHPFQQEALRIAKSGTRISSIGQARLTVLPEMEAALRFSNLDPGYVMRGSTDNEELETRLAHGDHVILTPINIPRHLRFEGDVSFRIMAGCPDDTADRIHEMRASASPLKFDSLDLLRRIADAPETFSFS